jgi:hypothetical protein
MGCVTWDAATKESHRSKVLLSINPFSENLCSFLTWTKMFSQNHLPIGAQTIKNRAKTSRQKERGQKHVCEFVQTEPQNRAFADRLSP